MARYHIFIPSHHPTFKPTTIPSFGSTSDGKTPPPHPLRPVPHAQTIPPTINPAAPSTPQPATFSLTAAPVVLELAAAELVPLGPPVAVPDEAAVVEVEVPLATELELLTAERMPRLYSPSGEVALVTLEAAVL